MSLFSLINFKKTLTLAFVVNSTASPLFWNFLLPVTATDGMGLIGLYLLTSNNKSVTRLAIGTMASIFFAFYFLQKFFAKLVFFANKKQKKGKKNQQHIYNHTSSPKLQ